MPKSKTGESGAEFSSRKFMTEAQTGANAAEPGKHAIKIPDEFTLAEKTAPT